jgi:hypothetical protein
MMRRHWTYAKIPNPKRGKAVKATGNMKGAIKSVTKVLEIG